jgi:hypothetical protein
MWVQILPYWWARCTFWKLVSLKAPNDAVLNAKLPGDLTPIGTLSP